MASGPVYGLPPETRCTSILVAGNREFDHYPLPAHADGSDALENCMAVCKTHHSYKTRNFDIPAEAKIKRVRKKHGIDPVTRKQRLWYVYEARTPGPLPGDPAVYQGAGFVDVRKNRSGVLLEGLFWTDRNWQRNAHTAGTIRLHAAGVGLPAAASGAPM